VIESPDHVASILAIDPTAWVDVWELCRRRLAALALRSEIAWSTVFKNSGGPAGASLEHVHSQILGLDFVPPVLCTELAAGAAAADPFRDLLRAAEADDRVVDEAADVAAIVPPAPRQPFEVWILPKLPEPYYHATTPARVAALATLTRSLVRRLESLVPRLAFNWWLHQAPHPAHAVIPARWHWHLEVLPRINGLAGFELGSGCHITTVSPRDSAERLRRA
jgi:UDPglucose--hexose-1-phosphate uridylyltransferase